MQIFDVYFKILMGIALGTDNVNTRNSKCSDDQLYGFLALSQYVCTGINPVANNYDFSENVL